MSAGPGGGSLPEAVRAECQRSLSPEEAARWLDAPWSDEERRDTLALVRWFRRRYPTPLERLAYVRRAHARWQRTVGIAHRTDGASRGAQHG